MPFSLKSFLTLIVAALFLTSCKTAETPAENPTRKFTDYQSAETWIKQNHKAEAISPDSSLIKKMEYYPSKNNGYLIIYLHRGKVPTLLYQNINETLWDAFKNTDSKGKFYNEQILGNENFTLEVEK